VLPEYLTYLDDASFIILIVDDLPANIGILMKYLENYGFRILVAMDGEKALETAMKIHPDLILLDVMMPGINGFETCARLKADANLRDIPVLFTSALSDTIDKVKGFRAGGVDYITKPFQVEEVLARIQTHLALSIMKRRLTEQNEQLRISKDLLQKANADLEEKVKERTSNLYETNQKLREEISERIYTEQELFRKNNELERTYEELADADERLKAQYSVLEEKQRELQLVKDRYLNVVEDQTELICRYKPDKTITFVNQAFCRYYSLNENIVGSVFSPDIPPSDRERLAVFFGSFTPDNPVRTIEHQVILPDGEIRWQEWSDRVIFDEEGNPTECLGVGRDITVKKDVQELNRRAICQIDLNIQQFAILNDQIRNPLTILMMMIDECDTEIGGKMIEQISRIDKLVDQLDRGLIESDKVQSFLRKHCQ
jgi:PAS domain S-box-containing protein